MPSAEILIYLFILITAFHIAVVFYEQTKLLKLFKNNYNKYCKSVDRWIPKIKQNISKSYTKEFTRM